MPAYSHDEGLSLMCFFFAFLLSSFFLLFCFIGEFSYPGRSRDTCDIIGRANHDTTGNDIGVTECFTHWENEKFFQRLTSYWQLGCNI